MEKNNFLKKMLVVGVIFLFMGSPTHLVAFSTNVNDRNYLENNKPIKLFDGSPIEWFGFSVSMDEGYIIVGSPGGEDIFGREIKGSAYVFKQDGTSWKIEQELTDISDLGNSVSISGDYAIVGTYDMAYIFRRDGNNWVRDTVLKASDSSYIDIFGKSVSISREYAIVGNPRTHNIKHYGSAYIFKNDGNGWVEEDILSVNAGSDDQFGDSVSLDGDYAIVGAYYEDNEKGAAYIFKRDGKEWLQQAKLVAPDAASGDRFGSSVSINDNYVIIGAPADDEIGQNSGSAYVFRRDDLSWELEEKLIPNGDYGPWYGWSVSINGEYVIAGTYLENDKQSDFGRGRAYIFKRDGKDWSQQARLAPSEDTTQSYFGNSVFIEGDYAVVGAPVAPAQNWFQNDAVYIFKRVDNDWIEEQILLTKPRAYLFSNPLFIGLLNNFPNLFPMLKILLQQLKQ